MGGEYGASCVSGKRLWSLSIVDSEHLTWEQTRLYPCTLGCLVWFIWCVDSREQVCECRRLFWEAVHRVYSGVDIWWVPPRLRNWGPIDLLAGGRCSDLLAGWVVRVRNPDGAGHFLFSVSIPNVHEALLASCAIGTGAVSPGVKRPKRGVDYPPLSSAEIKHQ